MTAGRCSHLSNQRCIYAMVAVLGTGSRIAESKVARAGEGEAGIGGIPPASSLAKALCPAGDGSHTDRPNSGAVSIPGDYPHGISSP